MPDSYSRKQVVFTQGQMVQVLDEMVRRDFSVWSQNLDGRYLKRLEQPLMMRCKDKTAKLDINFDKLGYTNTTYTQETQGIHIKVYIHVGSDTVYWHCVLLSHTKRYAVETKQFHLNTKTQIHVCVTRTVHMLIIYVVFMCSLFQQPIEPVL